MEILFWLLIWLICVMVCGVVLFFFVKIKIKNVEELKSEKLIILPEHYIHISSYYDFEKREEIVEKETVSKIIQYFHVYKIDLGVWGVIFGLVRPFDKKMYLCTVLWAFFGINGFYRSRPFVILDVCNFVREQNI